MQQYINPMVVVIVTILAIKEGLDFLK